MPPKRHHQNDENDPFAAVYTPERPHSKRQRRVLPKVDQAFMEEHQRRIQERQEREKLERETRQAAEEAQKQLQAEEEARAAATLLRGTLDHLRERHDSLDGFFDALLGTKDRAMSSQVTQLLDRHGAKYADAMHKRSPETMGTWATELIMDKIAAEGRRIASLLGPDRNQKLTTTLEQWHLEDVLATAKETAPTLLHALRMAATHEDQGQTRKDRDMVRGYNFSISVVLIDNHS